MVAICDRVLAFAGAGTKRIPGLGPLPGRTAIAAWGKGDLTPEPFVAMEGADVAAHVTSRGARRSRVRSGSVCDARRPARHMR